MHDKTLQLASGKNFAVLSTLLPDGRPQSHVMWIDVADGHLLINTEVHRRKYRNIEMDPRVTVTIFDRDDPYSFVEVRGTAVATVTGPEARAHIDHLSQKYHGHEYRNPITSERVIVRIAPEREIIH